MPLGFPDLLRPHRKIENYLPARGDNSPIGDVDRSTLDAFAMPSNRLPAVSLP
jgi:hypothetical protein